MGIVINILLVVAVLLALVFIAAMFSPNDFEIVQSMNINKSQQEVFDYLKILKNGEHFNKWMMADPHMQKDFKGTDGTVGFIYRWKSENKQVGEGEQEIIKLTGCDRIDYEIRFAKPFQGTSQAWFTLANAPENTTNVTWVFAGHNTYMMKVVHVVFNLKKVLAKDMKTSLTNLKTILEK